MIPPINMQEIPTLYSTIAIINGLSVIIFKITPNTRLAIIYTNPPNIVPNIVPNTPQIICSIKS